MVHKKKNTIHAKIKRTLTSVLPVHKDRRGSCIGCGECCKLPNRCPFLKFSEDGRSSFSIYKIMPLNCRKYPRTRHEFITTYTCGYKFAETDAKDDTKK
ncbi:MAG: hypothetical protein ABIG84_00190 [archaeon]